MNQVVYKIIQNLKLHHVFHNKVKLVIYHNTVVEQHHLMRFEKRKLLKNFYLLSYYSMQQSRAEKPRRGNPPKVMPGIIRKYEENFFLLLLRFIQVHLEVVVYKLWHLNLLQCVLVQVVVDQVLDQYLIQVCPKLNLKQQKNEVN